jgi:hypothetical protein
MVRENPPIAETGRLQKNFQFTQRIIFTMKKRGMKSSLERLEVCTSRISKWAERAEKNQNVSLPKRSKLQFVDSLATIQDNASRVYQALSEHLCQEKPRHPTGLLLEQRLRRSQTRKRVQQYAIFQGTTMADQFNLNFCGEYCQTIPHFSMEFKIIESSSHTRYISFIDCKYPSQFHD